MGNVVLETVCAFAAVLSLWLSFVLGESHIYLGVSWLPKPHGRLTGHGSEKSYYSFCFQLRFIGI